MNTLFFYQ